ncbi:hypothetical protein KGF56_000062 [Candida oxycetoniae]|uniref:Vam7p n=1 Tax=Candida oxycetoniae TaxID=497107 RepID=A0AAI9X0H8_9ASCO|nr:uncharacterized protein KGF56_000062 [Candida oxycetoniae]KAI3407075.2 hypothetical protein KGF56_000062 [Candida oxycetoniae]
MSITIPSEIDIDGSTYYQIDIKLPLRSYSIKRRYSDFNHLVSSLCHHLGINQKDFPHLLPGKRINWLNKGHVVEERKRELAQFLNNMICDKSLHNEPEFLCFLQLPKNFRFQDKPEITNDNWYEIYRKLKNDLINESAGDEKNVNLVRLKERMRNSYQPTIDNLSKAVRGDNKEETSKKKALVTQLQNILDQLQIYEHSKPRDNNTERRVLGGGGGGGSKKNSATETEETISLNNRELLQHQVQIQKDQDKELEHLRMMISRQRQIGETINTEVEEQNYILDKFNEEVENTTNKVQQARRRARKIL